MACAQPVTEQERRSRSSAITHTLLMIGCFLFLCVPTVADEVAWQPFQFEAAAKSQGPVLPDVAVMESGDLVLLALTNDVDKSVTSTGPFASTSAEPIDFWARSILDQRVTSCINDREDLKKQLRFQVARLGLPPTLTGGRLTNRPERLVLAICDHRHRFLSLCVGIPTADELMTMLEDAKEASMSLEASPDDRQVTTELLASRSIERVNHYYAERLQAALNKLMPVLDAKPPTMIVEERDDAAGTADEPDLDAKADAVVEDQRVDLETDFVTDVAPLPEPGDDEWEKTEKDDQWEKSIESIELPKLNADITRAMVESRLQLIERAITQLYRIDAQSRFGSGVGLSTPALIILEQHAEARAMWCDCVEPILVGMDMLQHWRPLVEACWEIPPVRFVDADADLTEWMTQTGAVSCIALDIRDSLKTVRVERELAVAPPRTSRSRVTWADLEAAMDQIPTRDVSTDQLAALIRENFVVPLDVLAPDSATRLVFPARSNKPLVVRANDSPARDLSRIKRLIKLSDKETTP